MAILGINEASFTTADKFLSTDPESPTICESVSDFTVSRGTMMPMVFGGTAEMEGDLQGNMFIKVAIYYAGGKFLGQYIAISDQQLNYPGMLPLTIEMDMAGTFELFLDH
jgi:hypothetical protein